MNTYIIVCDKFENEGLKKVIYNEIQTFSNSFVWSSIDFVWIIRSNLSSISIRDRLMKFFSQNENLLVLNLQGYGAWNAKNQDLSNKLKELF